MITLSVALGTVFAVALLLLSDVLPRMFTSDTAVLEQCALLWPIFSLMQPLNGAVFALDGILIGASDGPYIAGSMVVAFLACAVDAGGGGGRRLGCPRRLGGARGARRGARCDDGRPFRAATLARHRLGMIRR